MNELNAEFQKFALRMKIQCAHWIENSRIPASIKIEQNNSHSDRLVKSMDNKFPALLAFWIAKIGWMHDERLSDSLDSLICNEYSCRWYWYGGRCCCCWDHNFSPARKCLCIFHSFITLCNKNVGKWSKYPGTLCWKKNSWIDEEKCKCNILGYRFFYEESVLTFPNVCIFSILNWLQPISLKTLSLQWKISTKFMKKRQKPIRSMLYALLFFYPRNAFKKLSHFAGYKIKIHFGFMQKLFIFTFTLWSDAILSFHSQNIDTYSWVFSF